MARQFIFSAADTRLWLPARLDRDPTGMGDFAYGSVARLAPGASADAVQRELAAVLPRLAESFPRLASGATTRSWLNQARPAPVVVPLRDEVTHGVARTLWLVADLDTTAATGLLAARCRPT